MQVIDVRGEFQGAFTAKRRTTRYIVVHHAAGLYPTYTGILDCRAVRRYHVETKKWPGIGYHEGIAEMTEGGELAAYVFSDPLLQRAHILNRNHECYGISCLTHFDTHPDGIPLQKWFDALVERVKHAKTMFKNAQVVGHTDIAVAAGKTACPGKKWQDWRGRLYLALEAAATKPQPTSALRRYIIAPVQGANVRVAPRTSAPKLTALAHGTVVEGEITTKDTQPYSDDPRWLFIPNLKGYVWAGLVREVQ